MEATLEAVKRETRGKNEARRLRASGRIPAVIYGAQKEGEAGKNLPVAVDPKPLLRILHSHSGVNTLITVKVEGEGDSTVLVKEFLLDPVTNSMLHADLVRVNMDRRITVTVPIVIKGEPRGVKVEGGVLDFVNREIQLESLPLEIPDAIEVDVSNLGLNDAVYLRDVALGATWKPISDPDLMLVHVITPRLVETVTPEAAPAVAPVAAGSEPEVIKKGKPEKEGEAPAAKDKGKK
ncbi:MAG TPA: 50S ribosomal protein L25 [Vicinamibacterales bacterium]|nr:50S ribosomal protein L25 [Vicinamibacterales bacterium]